MVKITLIENTVEKGPVFEAFDLTTQAIVPCKSWFEKSKDKWHIVLDKNSANRKFVSHNEFFAKAQNGEYLVDDKTSGPRVLGTAEPDRKLVPYMTPEDKEEYEQIIARAKENKLSQTSVELSEEEKLKAKIAKYEAKLAALSK